MCVWNASLKNHDARWKLQWVWGQQLGWIPEKPHSDRRREARQNSGPPGPEQWIQFLQEERTSEGPDGSSHLPEHPRHWQILQVDLPCVLHIFQPNLLVSVFLGAPRLCLWKSLDIYGAWPAICMDLLTTLHSANRAAALNSLEQRPLLEEPRSPPAALPDLMALPLIHAVLCPTLCLSVLVCEQVMRAPSYKKGLNAFQMFWDPLWSLGFSCEGKGGNEGQA